MIDDFPKLPRLLDLDEVKRRTSLGRSAIYLLIESGELCRVKLGKKVTFLEDDVNGFINRRVSESRSRQQAAV